MIRLRYQNLRKLYHRFKTASNNSLVTGETHGLPKRLQNYEFQLVALIKKIESTKRHFMGPQEKTYRPPDLSIVKPIKANANQKHKIFPKD
jgi:hypothetical protein